MSRSYAVALVATRITLLLPKNNLARAKLVSFFVSKSKGQAPFSQNNFVAKHKYCETKVALCVLSYWFLADLLQRYCFFQCED